MPDHEGPAPWRTATEGWAEQGKRNEELHHQAMAAIAAEGRENRKHIDKLHAETMSEIGRRNRAQSALSERTAVLESTVGSST